MNNDECAAIAIDQFITDCWKKVYDYYSAAISEKNIYIFGAGIYGKFLFQALEHLGFKGQIKAFVINVESEESGMFGVPILHVNSIDFGEDDIVVVGVQNSSKVVDYLETQKINYIEADYDCSFYQNNLMYKVFKCIEVSSISDMPGKIELYYSGVLDDEDYILSLYEEESRSIIRNILRFYKTGKVEFIDSIPVNYAQYFQKDYYSLSDHEVYVDCGAFDGDSIIQFVEYTHGKYSKIIGIEPDAISFAKLYESTSSFNNVELINCATGKENTQISFATSGLLGAAVSGDSTGDIVEVKSLDYLIKDDPVSLIKMDIEGAELDTLIGAKELIRKYKPKLAVCIYHKLDDIIKIPEYLKELVPEYKFKVRQHSRSMLETVLYAEVDNNN